MRAFSSFRRKGPLSNALNGASDGTEHTKRRGEVGSTTFVNASATDVSLAVESTSGSSPPRRIRCSSAGYQALQPYGDHSIMEVSTSGSQQHIFAAVFTSEPTAYGGDFMKRNMHKELLVQMRTHAGNVPTAFKETIAALDRKYRALHIYNTYVLDGTHMVAAYVDISTNTLYLASNGGCRAVVSRRNGEQIEVLVDIGRDAVMVSSSGQQHSSGGKLSAGVATVQLSDDVEYIVLGSRGLWRELPAHTAALRLHHMHESAPLATGANAAAHLTQFALQTIVQRTVRQKDRRMAALKTPEHLQQLWRGDRSNFRWSARQPMRRRAGDVHGDLTAIVIQMDWEGSKRVPRNSSFSKKLRCAMSGKAVPRNSSGNSLACDTSSESLDGDSPRSVIPLARAALSGSRASAAAARHWDLVRMHFMHYLPKARAQARQQWYDTVDLALAASRKPAAEAAPAAAPSPVAAPSGPSPVAASTTTSPAATSPAVKTTGAVSVAVVASALQSSELLSEPIAPATPPASPKRAVDLPAQVAYKAAARAALAGRSYRQLPSVAVH